MRIVKSYIQTVHVLQPHKLKVSFKIDQHLEKLWKEKRGPDFIWNTM